MSQTINQVIYIWIDGHKPTQCLRSKTRFIPTNKSSLELEQVPEWGYDGSSTYQAEGSNSDLILKPVRLYPNPLRGANCYLVMCEVFSPDGEPHPTNHRAKLRAVLENGGAEHEVWFGFEQEYTLFDGTHPLGWPEGGYPAPQGPFYCGVGNDEAYGRDMVEEHSQACINADIIIFGTNAEVMPGQWEFQIGYRGGKDEVADALRTSDDLWVARWLLYRIGEAYNISATLDPKPVKGDWNGAGKHTNMSTKEMRDPRTGMHTINEAIKKLELNHADHIIHYGHGLENRLTGKHETADIDTFSSGVSDRGASIRIPQSVAQNGYGYLEDRRPGANADPYTVSRLLIQTVCGIK